MNLLRHVDLCSGIGGFALGFEWAKLSKPVLFCDIEPWSRQILAKHWPDVPIAEDVKELANDPDRNVPKCDILTAGYPCQPFSQAGKRRGTEDDRHIWPYIFSIIQVKRPTWCVFENVYGHVSLGLDEVLSDLESEAYATRPFIVPACAVDAPHRRDRLWIICRNVANADSTYQSRRSVPSGVQTQHDNTDSTSSNGRSENVANTDSKGLQGQWREHEFVSKREAEHSAGRGGKEVRAREYWKSEPRVGRVAHGIPRRVDRLKGLGNAIVPQIAMRIGLTVKQIEEQDGR